MEKGKRKKQGKQGKQKLVYELRGRASDENMSLIVDNVVPVSPVRVLNLENSSLKTSPLNYLHFLLIILF
ncbi:hypothetical protein UA38_09685 [Photobacterium kishitanii]|uniref:Uncharacterized protein n=1 Tax=Photobacterium kishitanii TaxID=318456 RepID=A0AAX0Z0D2_9GAMM|nr:hypothetical protein UA38_09685 [Photobacterium kishitanii]KJG61188.1 hypothetical protein UA42_11135 [Photobacterium kishitanii]KJG65380.1 hypothetical protein UA40_11595 [Photobacterium kishitanii]KJG69486.1 hypothetical protein UA41_10850 [Photobacterium kishitanii]PSX21496.1 hypothetical protein C0W70_04500 [Photobacterium kishitanii]